MEVRDEPTAKRDFVRPRGFVVVERSGQQVPQEELDQPGFDDEADDSEQVTVVPAHYEVPKAVLTARNRSSPAFWRAAAAIQMPQNAQSVISGAARSQRPGSS